MIEAALTAQKNSNTLTLASLNIGEEECLKVLDYMRVNPYIVTLNLEHNNIDQPAMRIISKIVETSPSLRYLNLSWNNIGDGLVFFIKALESNLESKLTELDLSQNELNHDHCVRILDIISKSSTLQTLNLNWNKIGDAGAEILLKGLKK